MALTTTTNQVGGVIVVYVSGDIFFGEESVCLRTLVKRLLRETKQIVFDLGKVMRIDSGSVGTLMAVYASARQVGGDIKFANLSNHTEEVFKVTKLVTVFEIFNKVEDAVASFHKAGESS